MAPSTGGFVSLVACGVKGVSLHKASQHWRAQIKIHGELKHLGYFDTEQEAGEAGCRCPPTGWSGVRMWESG